MQFKPKFIDQPLNPHIPEQIKKQVEIIKSNFNLNAPIFQPNFVQGPNSADDGSQNKKKTKKKKKKKKNKDKDPEAGAVLDEPK